MNTSKEQGSGRLESLDALRGADMLIIIGLEGLLRALAMQYPGSEAWQETARQMGHAAWEGLRVYDMVFPLFVFIAGVAMGLSQEKRRAAGQGSWSLLGKWWKRAAVLVLLGWVVNGPLSWDSGSMRYASVLGLIGISCAVAGSISLAARKTAAQAGICVGLLVALWAAQYFGGDMSPSGCLNARIDQLLLPGVVLYETLDPEGVMCHLSAVVLALSGLVCGGIMRIRKPELRLACMAGIGLLLLVIGYSCCGAIIKNIWSTGFVVCAAGWGFVLMAGMHLIIDIWGLRRWATPLRVVGTNALFIYLCTHVISVHSLTGRLFGGTIRCLVPETWGAVAHNTAYLLLAWGLCYVLYRRRVFLKI